MPPNVPMKLAQRLLLSQGILESGQIANMRTYLLPRDVKIHTRLLAEDRTLCGIPVRGYEGRWAWQFVHRGRFGSHLPSGAEDLRHRCKRCARSPVLTLTEEVVRSRRLAFHEAGSIRV
jgi:hypothetical protein